jgi:hypothetical protein
MAVSDACRTAPARPAAMKKFVENPLCPALAFLEFHARCRSASTAPGSFCLVLTPPPFISTTH